MGSFGLACPRCNLLFNGLHERNQSAISLPLMEQPRRIYNSLTDFFPEVLAISRADIPTGCATRLLLGAPRLLDHCRSPHAQSGGGSWLSGFTVGLAAGCT